jgi:macrolide-specific efflux system membrane fusion protein
VEIGDVVKKDQLLAEIDPTVIETRVRTDKANLDNLQAQFAQQQAELKLSRLQLKRNQALFKSKAISQDALQTSETQVAVGEAKADALSAQIAAAQATYDGDVANLGYTKIYAPMAGTIVSQTALEGQTLNANQTAPTILRVADLQTMTVKAQVAEADVVKLTPGMPVYFTTLGLPERRWRATVRQILPTPETVNDVVLYNVLIDVENDDGVLMTSMTAQVFFVLGEAKQVPMIPIAALGKKQPGSSDEYLVRVLTPKGSEPRAVKIGLTDRKSAQIVDGLAVGDRVVIETPAASGEGGSGGNRPFGMGFRL